MREREDGIGSSWFGGRFRHASIQDLFLVWLISSNTSIWSGVGWMATETSGETVLLYGKENG